jgi:hypothetical protein
MEPHWAAGRHTVAGIARALEMPTTAAECRSIIGGPIRQACGFKYVPHAFHTDREGWLPAGDGVLLRSEEGDDRDAASETACKWRIVSTVIRELPYTLHAGPADRQNDTRNSSRNRPWPNQLREHQLERSATCRRPQLTAALGPCLEPQPRAGMLFRAAQHLRLHFRPQADAIPQ